ncbi:MAG: aerobic respiration control sensor protein ArcB [ANME-2 cluster archaeon HR1]|jgi:PAS domain S-box-containing protein|nr:MAG: aerobic respiration control sensor protein ArcB [ANME-2 cluster archaeon HR1]
MKIKKSDLVNTYAPSIGIEIANELVTNTISVAALEDKENYNIEEITRICSELVKEPGIIRIIAQTFLVQQEHRLSDEQTLLLDNIETQVWYLTDMGNYGLVNKAHADFFGMQKKQMEDNNIFIIFNEPEASVFIKRNREVFKLKKTIRTEEWIKNSNQESCLLSIVRTPRLSDNGNVEYVICTAEDITQRRRSEDQIKSSLKEKEVLLREIHHRVKNNLQIVSSLLNMQIRKTKDKKTIDILSESGNRINAMALIHSQLYETNNLSQINMKRFVDNLFSQLLMNCDTYSTKITHKAHVIDYPFPISLAVPVGLIINELLSNIIKHAFNERKEGKIELIMSRLSNGKIHLSISDDGIGLPEGFDIQTSETLGLFLVKILTVDQLEGKIEFISNKGTTVNIEFEIEDYVMK